MAARLQMTIEHVHVVSVTLTTLYLKWVTWFDFPPNRLSQHGSQNTTQMASINADYEWIEMTVG